MAKIRDESNQRDDAALPKRDREAGQRAIAEQRKAEEQSGFSVGGHDNASPDGWTSPR